MDETPKLSLPYMVEAQANKEVYYNQVLHTLDALIFLTVRNIYNSPPQTITNGDRFLVGSSPTGIFSGKSKKIAQYIESTWNFYTPQNGWVLYNETDDTFYKYLSGYNIWEKFVHKTFLDNKDTPNEYANYGKMYPMVNEAEDGIIFSDTIYVVSENGTRFKLIVSDTGLLATAIDN